MKFLSEALQGQTKYMNEALLALQNQSKSMNEALQNQSKHMNETLHALQSQSKPMSEALHSQSNYMNEALQQSLQHNQQNFETLKALADKLADALRPAARQALSPIGHSCQRIDLYAEGKQFMTLDTDHKRAFSHAAGMVTEHLEPYIGVISQFDMTTGACRLTLEGATSRIPAIVVDPIFDRPNNRYVKAMTSADPIRFLAKAELDEDGNPIRLYISDTSEREAEPA
ncbi:hypothetical protein CR51_24845 [Caballeronia megalochromosomata]|nr:hypothetical protein CR51_24845 [Caballeronia megalochromosomata]